MSWCLDNQDLTELSVLQIVPTSEFQLTSWDTNTWLIFHQRDDFQLKMNHKAFGGRAVPTPQIR